MSYMARIDGLWLFYIIPLLVVYSQRGGVESISMLKRRK